MTMNNMIAYHVLDMRDDVVELPLVEAVAELLVRDRGRRVVAGRGHLSHRVYTRKQKHQNMN